MINNLVRVESYGNFREGISAKGKPYIMGEAFVYLNDPMIPHAQQFSYYCADRKEVLLSGQWLVPLKWSVRDGRIEFQLDTENATPFIEPKPRDKDSSISPSAKVS